VSRLPSFLAGAALAAAIALPISLASGRQDPAAGHDMAEMMKKAEKFTKPGPNHAMLARFIGTWDTSFQLCHGDQKMPAEPGTSQFSWLFEGRWLQQESRGTMMGMPIEGFGILGYDNFKMSFVNAFVSTMDTALNTSEGDLDQGGKNLISYGRLDEYLTGEHDKTFKTAWRFISDDEMLFEVHDFAIGEVGTKVIEIRYTRKK
jgi:hypothetical protein